MAWDDVDVLEAMGVDPTNATRNERRGASLVTRWLNGERFRLVTGEEMAERVTTWGSELGLKIARSPFGDGFEVEVG